MLNAIYSLLFLAVLFAQFDAHATSCEMNRRSFLAAMTAAAGTAAMGPVANLGATASAAPTGVAPSLASLIDSSCSLDDTTRRWLKWNTQIRLDPADLSSTQRAQIRGFMREIADIGNHPEASSQVRQFAQSFRSQVRSFINPTDLPQVNIETNAEQRVSPRQVVDEPEVHRVQRAEPPNRTRVSDPQRRPTRLEMMRENRVAQSHQARMQRLSSLRASGLGTKAIRLGFRVFGVVNFFMSAGPAYGAIGDRYIMEDGQHFHEFFDLPESQQNYILERSSGVSDRLDAYFEAIIDDIGGRPRQLQCEPGHAVFNIAPASITETHRSVEVIFNEDQTIREMIVKGYEANEFLYQGFLTFEEQEIATVTPFLNFETRVLDPLNRMHTAEEYDELYSRMGAEEMGTIAFLSDLNEMDLYLELIANDFVACGAIAPTDTIALDPNQACSDGTQSCVDAPALETDAESINLSRAGILLEEGEEEDEEVALSPNGATFRIQSISAE